MGARDQAEDRARARCRPGSSNGTSASRSSRTTPHSATRRSRRSPAGSDSGAPRGNPADMPPPRQFADAGAWTLGTPDLIVSSPVVTVKAVAPDLQGDIGIDAARVDRGPLRQGGAGQGSPAERARGRRRRRHGPAGGAQYLGHPSRDHRGADGVRSERASSPTTRSAAAAANSTWCTSSGRTRRSIPTISACCCRRIRCSRWRVHMHSSGKEVRGRGSTSGSSSTRRDTSRSTS